MRKNILKSTAINNVVRNFAQGEPAWVGSGSRKKSSKLGQSGSRCGCEIEFGGKSRVLEEASDQLR